MLSERFNHTALMPIVGQDLPEIHNQVTLHPILSDSDGIPAPKISYQLGQNSEKMMVFAVAQAREAMRAAGAVEIFVNHHLRLSGYNLMGTACMGSSTAGTVYDGIGGARAHDIKNLFIVDGSVFPTSGSVNAKRSPRLP